ncbi:hypothetical protein K1719_045507 [Acacia pycnantha]|nr:hypothetical protein K1719_045507 [Acacia pycnantha]
MVDTLYIRSYTESKTESEKETLSYNEEGGGSMEVVSLACGLVGGDTILSSTPQSVELLISQLKDSEIHSLFGKFLVASSFVSSSDIATYYLQSYPHFHVKQKYLEKSSRSVTCATSVDDL